MIRQQCVKGLNIAVLLVAGVKCSAATLGTLAGLLPGHACIDACWQPVDSKYRRLLPPPVATSSSFVTLAPPIPDRAHAQAGCLLHPAGRGGNSWVSPAGCLMFSCLWSLKVPGSQAPFINYVISLALIRAVRDAMRAAAPVRGCT